MIQVRNSSQPGQEMVDGSISDPGAQAIGKSGKYPARVEAPFKSRRTEDSIRWNRPTGSTCITRRVSNQRVAFGGFRLRVERRRRWFHLCPAGAILLLRSRASISPLRDSVLSNSPLRDPVLSNF